MKFRITIISLFFILPWTGSIMKVHADDPLAGFIKESYESKADSLTNALVKQFLNTTKGIFWSVPRDRSNKDSETKYIYWQQAHAMDVIIYSYERIKETNSSLAFNYRQYMTRWYANHANNWYSDSSDKTGFVNEYTDDMCWICLTLIHMSEALGDDRYVETAKTLFDNSILPRGWEDNDGYFGLPWKLNSTDRNACTNAPGCLVAAKLYEKYNDQTYLDAATRIYDFWENVMKTKFNSDGRVEEPPLSYTQGTFGEACRRLYHITNDSKYLQMARKVIYYAVTSSRCVDRNILRHEGTSMDQSIFKAVLIPYAVNFVLDESASKVYRQRIATFLENNAKTLWSNLDKDSYPKMYCNYYWAEPVDESSVPSMGAMVSGASLMENVARMAMVLQDKTSVETIEYPLYNSRSNGIYSLDGRLINDHSDDISDLKPGIYVVNGKKLVVR